MFRNNEMKRVLISFFSFLLRYLETREEFGKAMKIIAGCGILVKKERVRDKLILA